MKTAAKTKEAPLQDRKWTEIIIWILFNQAEGFWVWVDTSVLPLYSDKGHMIPSTITTPRSLFHRYKHPALPINFKTSKSVVFLGVLDL